MKGAILAIIVIAVISGCASRTTTRYSVSIDNNQTIKAYAGSAAKLESLGVATTYSTRCRLGEPISAPDGMSIDQYILKAINDDIPPASTHAGVRFNLC